MPDYLLITDLPLLQSRGFVAGFSGESWFGADKNGATWQAYIQDKDPKITFVGPEDRASVYMTRATFEELFA
jgi:hypothetical protein